MTGAAVRDVEHVDGPLHAELLRCWSDVTAAGGAVGFLPHETAADIAPVLDDAVARVETGAWTLGVLEVDGALGGFGFVDRYTAAVKAHRGRLLRLQVRPELAGRGLGRILLEGLEGLAAARGIEILEATYREGLGLGDFYAACGWREVGRIPGALRVGEDDVRDEVIVARWLDEPVLRGSRPGR